MTLGTGEAVTLTVGAGATMQNLVDAINEGNADGTVGGITIAEGAPSDALAVLNGKLTATIETTGGVSHLKILNETGDTLTLAGTVGDKLGVSAVVGDTGSYTSTNTNTFSASTVLFDELDTGTGTAIAADDELSIKVANTTYTFTVSEDGQTVQDLIDWINDTVPGVGAAIGKNDNGVSGLQLYFNQGIDSEDITFTEAGTTGLLTIFGITTDADDHLDTVASAKVSVQGQTMYDSTGSFTRQFNDLKSQLDLLIKDASYKSVNLLQTGNDMKVQLSETVTSILTVESVNYNVTSASSDLVVSKGVLGAKNAEVDFTAGEDHIDGVLGQLTEAYDEIRTSSRIFGTNLATIKTRNEFETETIEILNTGADKLTLANMNEESAKMLALQTRSQLATTTLSMASQNAQSIMQLFR